MLDLPQELTDKIIDCLHDDKLSLVRCSHVCRAWVPATRFHIFSDITLRRRWKRLMQPQFRTFLDLLASRSCTFAPSVIHLTLEHLDGTPAQGQEVSPGFSVLSNLTSVTSLTFNGWRNLGVQPVHDLIPHLAALSEITLKDVAFSSPGQLFEMLEACLSLTSFTAESVSCNWKPFPIHIPYSRFGCIRKLRLAYCRIAGFLDVFAPENVRKLNCDTLEIHGLTVDDIPSVIRFLALAAGHLRHLSVGFSLVESDGLQAERLFSKRIDLQNHSQLATVNLKDIYVDHDSMRSVSMLSTLRCALVSPHIEELLFHMRLYDAWPLDNLRWEEIDEALSSRSLRLVEFRIDGGGMQFRNDISESIVKRLPLTCAPSRHTVQIVFGDSSYWA